MFSSIKISQYETSPIYDWYNISIKTNSTFCEVLNRRLNKNIPTLLRTKSL